MKESKPQNKARLMMTRKAELTSANLPATKSAQKIDLSLAIEYRYKNHLTFDEIAAKFGVTRQAVEQRLKSIIKLIGTVEVVTSYDNNRAAFLTGIERQLVKQLIDKRKIKAATLGNVAYAIDKINNIKQDDKAKSGGGQAITIQVINYTDRTAEGVKIPDGQGTGIKQVMIPIG
jgi:predicted DNA-binding protein YlxM (UPF0122 family)